jgi:hypothetical protein
MLRGLSIRDPQGSSSEQLLAVDPDPAHCQIEEAWWQTMLIPSRIGQTGRLLIESIFYN